MGGAKAPRGGAIFLDYLGLRRGVPIGVELPHLIQTHDRHWLQPSLSADEAHAWWLQRLAETEFHDVDRLQIEV